MWHISMVYVNDLTIDKTKPLSWQHTIIIISEFDSLIHPAILYIMS